MGLSYEFLVYSNSGTVDLQNPSGGADPDALLRTLYPRTPYRRVDEIGLLNGCRQPHGRLAVGAYGDGVLIVTKDAHLSAVLSAADPATGETIDGGTVAWSISGWRGR